VVVHTDNLLQCLRLVGINHRVIVSRGALAAILLEPLLKLVKLLLLGPQLVVQLDILGLLLGKLLLKH
jgi:hypothetical protein